jgi:hypothetical protein
MKTEEEEAIYLKGSTNNTNNTTKLIRKRTGGKKRRREAITDTISQILHVHCAALCGQNASGSLYVTEKTSLRFILAMCQIFHNVRPLHRHTRMQQTIARMCMTQITI